LKDIIAIKRFKRFLQIEKGLSPNSIYSYTYDLKKFSDFLARKNKTILNATQDDVEQFLFFEKNKKQIPDIRFKVFDTVEAPKLKVDAKGQIQFPELNTDAISRIYNMIFTVGLDEPTQVPEEVVKDCIYKIGNHYYITNSEKVSKEQFAECIKNGKVFIDGWTASLNATLQHYKEDVKIIF
jgi:adenine-specific DNA-methyltransferase